MISVMKSEGLVVADASQAGVFSVANLLSVFA